MAKTPGRLLLVDDEPALLKMMTVYLERRGYAVEAIAGTDEAWSRIAADPGAYAVAVLDGSMPGLPSAELALRMLQVNPAARVIATSGYPSDISSLDAAAPGRAAFLPKPFTPEMLAMLVEKMLAPEEKSV